MEWMMPFPQAKTSDSFISNKNRNSSTFDEKQDHVKQFIELHQPYHAIILVYPCAVYL